jgi:hypothetical protein
MATTQAVREQFAGTWHTLDGTQWLHFAGRRVREAGGLRATFAVAPQRGAINFYSRTLGLLRGIYAFVGDELTLCLNAGRRPTAFTNTGGQMLLRLSRDRAE